MKADGEYITDLVRKLDEAPIDFKGFRFRVLGQFCRKRPGFLFFYFLIFTITDFELSEENMVPI
ncbi:hypothetical protein [Bacillus xiapuensis]|uniref:Uncharacterized protein n=1 Tax=Bacillus xiapuensis TaxID=2014075 RepID=A0ABU6NDW7_9BACI|nr:hypothetical protein [Bacillus xiapuensis]